ncbi:MAG TPA: hypothetical protein VKU41_29175 [Polyangiaceae bacterium]|nr:hypothetical protein [Polyangiaceae bacterium]
MIPLSSPGRVAFVLVLGAALGACSREGRPVHRGEDAAPAAVASSAGPVFESDDVRSVYPLDAGTPDPRVLRLCSALQEEPAVRAAECRHTTPGVRVTGECVRMLATAVREGATTLAADAADRCAAAMDRVLSGCGWVPNAPQPPGECQDVLRGTVPEGVPCRSSLECVEELHCDGVGPTRAGTCRRPQGDGATCHGSVDPLAVYARQTGYEAHHPECRGRCAGRRCVAVAP